MRREVVYILTITIGLWVDQNGTDWPVKGEYLVDIACWTLFATIYARGESLERIELLAFITPTVVHRPLDNYENYNREDLIRLEEVAKPLADQVVGRSWFSEGEMQLNISERITADKNAEEAKGRVEDGLAEPPDRDAIQTEIDNIESTEPPDAVS